MDVFVECMVKRKKTGADYGKITGIIAAALFITIAIVLFIIWSLGTSFAGAINFLFAIFIIAIAAAWFFAFKLISKLSIEYEYAFTNGELDVDAIYSKKDRKNLLTVRAKEFKTCAKVFDERYKKAYLGRDKTGRTIDASDGETNSRTYFADFFHDGDMTRLLFTPSKSMIRAMYRYNPKCIHIDEETEENNL